MEMMELNLESDKSEGAVSAKAIRDYMHKLETQRDAAKSERLAMMLDIAILTCKTILIL